MTQHESNTVNMFDTVIGVYTLHETVFNSYLAIVDCHTEFVTLVAEVKQINTRFKQAISGKTAQRDNAADSLIALVLPVKAALYSYAVNN